jgi:hypothetical protein
LRLLRQLYPEVRIKLLYARDFRALMVKYGRLDFLLEMNGANGNGANGNSINGNGASGSGRASRGRASIGAPKAARTAS